MLYNKNTIPLILSGYYYRIIHYPALPLDSQATLYIHKRDGSIRHHVFVHTTHREFLCMLIAIQVGGALQNGIMHRLY